MLHLLTGCILLLFLVARVRFVWHCLRSKRSTAPHNTTHYYDYTKITESKNSRGNVRRSMFPPRFLYEYTDYNLGTSRRSNQNNPAMKKINKLAAVFGGLIGTHSRQRGDTVIGVGYHWSHCSQPRLAHGDYNTADEAYKACKAAHYKQYKNTRL
jgi:hypothetical protein